MLIKNIKLPKSTATLTAYCHEKPSTLLKSMLVLPGGGYTACSEREGKPIAKAYYAKGYQAFVLTYRTEQPFNFEHTWQDANAALQYLHNHKVEWSLDEQAIFVIGFSAGGHLAASLAVSGTIRPAAVILCYPLIIDSLAKLLSNQLQGIEHQVTKRTPPIFIFSTFQDHVVPVRNTIRLLEALNEWDIPFESHIYTWGHHGMALANDSSAYGNQDNIDEHVATWFSLSLSWLKRLIETKYKNPKEVKKHTIGYYMQEQSYKEELIQMYPILTKKEIREVVNHMSLQEFEKFMLKSKTISH